MSACCSEHSPLELLRQSLIWPLTVLSCVEFYQCNTSQLTLYYYIIICIFQPTWFKTMRSWHQLWVVIRIHLIRKQLLYSHRPRHDELLWYVLCSLFFQANQLIRAQSSALMIYLWSSASWNNGCRMNDIVFVYGFGRRHKKQLYADALCLCLALLRNDKNTLIPLPNRLLLLFNRHVLVDIYLLIHQQP